MRPAVSVVVPTRGRNRLLRLCLRGLAEQTCRDFEAVIVHDGERPAERLRFDPGRFPFPLKQVFLPSKRGPAHCRNRGVRETSGEWLAFLDSDDRWAPEKLAAQLRAVRKRPGVRLCHTGYANLSAAGRRLSVREPIWTLPFLRRKWRLKTGVCTSSVLMKRSLMSRIGSFDENFKYLHDDTELWVRAALVLPPSAVLFLPRPLVLRRKHSRQISRGLPRGFGAGDYASKRAKDAGMDLVHFCRKHLGTRVLDP